MKTKVRSPMKLFVWDGVLTDHTSGIMFAIAPSIEDARKQLRKHVGVDNDLVQDPTVYRVDRRVNRAVWGGG
jgi:hypothetical protein